jgi:hypothetical protein
VPSGATRKLKFGWIATGKVTKAIGRNDALVFRAYDLAWQGGTRCVEETAWGSGTRCSRV